MAILLNGEAPHNYLSFRPMLPKNREEGLSYRFSNTDLIVVIKGRAGTVHWILSSVTQHIHPPPPPDPPTPPFMRKHGLVQAL